MERGSAVNDGVELVLADGFIECVRRTDVWDDHIAKSRCVVFEHLDEVVSL